jgi:hypothetical protein
MPPRICLHAMELRNLAEIAVRSQLDWQFDQFYV